MASSASAGPSDLPTQPIHLLIAEDQTLMREGLRTVLELEPGFAVVGAVANGVEVVRQAAALRPEIILMDVRMPQLSGVEATAAIMAQGLPCRIIILTTFDYEDYVFDAIKAGAVGYLLKDTPAAQLVATIRQVAAGESFIQPQVATRLLMEYGRELGRPSDQRPRVAVSSEQTTDLSTREVDVVRLLAIGASNREIADRLVLAEGTVKNHVSNILAKLHAANRTQAANLARERGLI